MRGNVAKTFCEVVCLGYDLPSTYNDRTDGYLVLICRLTCLSKRQTHKRYIVICLFHIARQRYEKV